MIKLKTMFEKHNINLEENFYKDIKVFIELLQKWGKVHNLSGSLDEDSIYENILDSVFPLTFIENFSSFADIGTGAGYPGLILAIARKDSLGYLIEPRIKRVAFLSFVKANLGLNNLTILQKRVEAVDDLKAELITSRAVTNTKLLIELTKNIKQDNSSYLFYKGSMLENEIEEAKLNDYKVVSRSDRNYLYIKG